MFKHVSLALAVSALMTGVTAQTTSSCNPLTNTTCSDDIALDSTYSYSFTDGEDSDNWSTLAGNVSYTTSGAEFTINEKGDAPTIATNWYIFFGRVEVHMKAANGTGIVSSAVLLSDDLDEIDWEWLGGENDNVQTNYFYQGNSSSTAGESDTTVDDSQGTSHNYTVDWTKESCTWYIDGTSIRTLAYSDDDYPQTPMQIKLGIWAGGDSDNAEGTIEWAGGETDYDDAPFTMIVESIKVTNYNPGYSYTYSDQTGSYDSITINEDDTSSSNSTSSSTVSTTTTTMTNNSTTVITKAASATVSASTATNTPKSGSTVSALADTTGSSSTTTTPTATVSTSSASGISPAFCMTFAVVATAFLGHL